MLFRSEETYRVKETFADFWRDRQLLISYPQTYMPGDWKRANTFFPMVPCTEIRLVKSKLPKAVRGGVYPLMVHARSQEGVKVVCGEGALTFVRDYFSGSTKGPDEIVGFDPKKDQIHFYTEGADVQIPLWHQITHKTLTVGLPSKKGDNATLVIYTHDPKGEIGRAHV